MESVAAARRPVIDNVHGAPQPQDELGPGMLVPRLWSPDSCLDTRQTRFLSKAVSARPAGYTPGRKRGPEREGIGRNDAGRSPGKGPGFAPGTFPREASGGIAEPLLGEASGEAASRSEVATNSKYVASDVRANKVASEEVVQQRRAPRRWDRGNTTPGPPLGGTLSRHPRLAKLHASLPCFANFLSVAGGNPVSNALGAVRLRMSTPPRRSIASQRLCVPGWQRRTQRLKAPGSFTRRRRKRSGTCAICATDAIHETGTVSINNSPLARIARPDAGADAGCMRSPCGRRPVPFGADGRFSLTRRSGNTARTRSGGAGDGTTAARPTRSP